MQQAVFDSGSDVVSAVRRELAERIGCDRFELWFGPQVQWQVTATSVRVTAPNTFLLDRLRRQFAPEIQLAVQAICGAHVQAEFQVAEMPAAAPAEAGHVEAVSAAHGEPAHGEATSPRDLPRRAVPGGGLQTARLRSADGLRPSAEEPSRGEPRRRRPATLASFVVGEGNRVASTAAQSVVQRPGVVTPLFLYGPPGTGKSHLLEGMCHATRSGPRRARALLLSAEQFTCLFLEALQGSGLPNFRRKCRDVDLLAVDDIQFFAGKKATLLEFQHTLDALARQGRQVAVSADRAPAELAPLGTELVTRLTGGLVCGIESADYETRLGLTRQFAGETAEGLPEDVLRLIAMETCGDARQIRGALNRLRATSEACGTPVTLESARRALGDIFAASHRMVRLPDVERAVCEVFGMDAKALRDGNKARAVSQPRMLAMWLARKYTRAAFSEIGEFFGRRSHSTVISAERKVSHWMERGMRLQLGRSSWSVDEAIRRIEARLRTG